MNVAVIGSRNFGDRDAVERWFGENWREDWHLISGGAHGVDSWAEEIAAVHGDDPLVVRPNYQQYPPHKYGKDFAPKARNKEIVDRADRVVAFWDGRSSGTSHAIAWALALGKPVTIKLSPKESP